MPDLIAGRNLDEQLTLVRSLGTDGEAEVWLLRDTASNASVVAWILPPGALEEAAARLRNASVAIQHSCHPKLPPFQLRHTGARWFLTWPIRQDRDLGPLRILVSRVLAGTFTEAAPDGTTLEDALRRILVELSTPLDQALKEPAPGVPVTPPPRIRAIEPIAIPVGSRQTERHRVHTPRRHTSLLALLSLVVLILLAAGSIFLLPIWEQNHRRGIVHPIEVKGTPATSAATPELSGPTPEASRISPEQRRDRASLRQRLRESRDLAVELEQSLQKRGADLWAHDDYQKALVPLVKGQEQWTAEELLLAEASYREAVRLLKTLDARSSDVLAENVQQGQAALAAGDALKAGAAFSLALRIAPGNKAATTGLRRAEVFDKVRARITAGSRSERQGDLREATVQYKKAIALDPLSRKGQESLARVQGRLRDDSFAQSMSEGLAALDGGDFETAGAAFQAAANIRPHSPQVAEAFGRVEQGLKLKAIHHHNEMAQAFETQERWTQAAQKYQAILELDATVRSAQEGKARSQKRADLYQRMQSKLSHPDRLTSDAVLKEASDLLDEAREIPSAGQVHQAQIEKLAELVAMQTKTIHISLESDNLTEVTVYHVGRLGKFLHHELDLRPGTYTVVGSRRGYRDVRRQLKVVSGADPHPLVVRCEELI